MRLNLNLDCSLEEIEEQIQKFCNENNIDRGSLYPTSINYGSLEHNDICTILLKKVY